MSNTVSTSKSTLRFICGDVAVSNIFGFWDAVERGVDVGDINNVNDISDTVHRQIDEVATNLALFDAAAPSGLRLGVAVYFNDGRVGVSVSAMRGANGKSLLCSGTPHEAVLVTAAASLLQQI